MVVDLVIPTVKVSAYLHTLPLLTTQLLRYHLQSKVDLQQSLERTISYIDTEYMSRQTHLISIAPEEVLGSKVLVRVLRSLLQRRQVLPMSPMLIPQVVRIHASNYQSRDRHATKVNSIPASILHLPCFGNLTRLTACARDLGLQVSFQRTILSPASTHHL